MENQLNSRELKRLESDRRILEATIKVVCQKGYTNAGFREIALEAGITPGLINQRFETKENLLIRAIDYTDTIWREEMMPEDMSIEKLLSNIISDIKEDYKRNKTKFHFVYTILSGTDIPASVLEKQREFFFNSGLYKALKVGQDRGYVPKGDLAILYKIFIVNTLRLVMDYSQNEIEMPDDAYFMKLIQYRDPIAEEQQVLRNKAFDSISRSFFSLVYCNITTGTYWIDRTINRIEACSKETNNAQDFLYKACDIMVDINDRDRVKTFLDLSTVMQRIGSKKVIAIDFNSYNYVNHRFSFIVVDKDKNNEIVLCGVQEIENN